MVNSFGPGNQKIPAKPGNSKGVKKYINPLANTPMGGTPAANPMGGAQMDFGMGDMGGMQMNAPSPTGGGDGGYENFMMGMTAINGEQPSGFQGKMNPGVLEGPSTAGGGIAGMSSMGAQPTGMAVFAGAAPAGAQSPQVAGWNDPAMGGFQMDTPMMNDPMMGGMQMGQPDIGQPFMGDPVMGQLQGPAGGGAGQQPPPGQPPQGNAPDGWQGEFDENPIAADWQDHQDEYNQYVANKMQPAWDWQKNIYDEQLRLQDEIPGVDVVKNPWDIQQDIIDSAADKTKRNRSSFAGGQAPAGGDALGDALSGGSQAVSPVAPPVSQAPATLPPPSSLSALRDDGGQFVPYDVGSTSTVPSQAPVVEPAVAPTAPPKSSAYPPMVRDESGNMVTAPGWQSGKFTDTPEPSRRKPYMPPSQGPAGMPMDSELEAEWREKNPGEPLPELDDTPEPGIDPRFISKRAPGQPMPEGFNPDGTPVAPAVSLPPTGVSSSMPPAGVKNWKGDDTPFEPVLRDDRFISKRVERPATPADDAGEKTELEPDRNYGTDPDPRAVGPPMVTPKDKPALEEFKDKVDAGEVSDEGPAGSTGPVSEGAMMDERNWDTVDGEYKFMGADYHKQNTRPETDTKDWEETREEAAEDIKEGDKFSEVGDAAYGTASSESRSAANEADLGIPDMTTGMGMPGPPKEEPDVGNWGGSPPPISLPPTQPQTDKDYYDKLVNPDPFQNPIIPDLPKGYGSQRVEGGGEYHEFPGREYDVKPEEIFDEYGEPLMGSQGIDSNAGGMTVADVRRRGTTPAQVQALVNNEVANTYQQANQGLGAMTGARPGMSGDIGSYAQQALGPEVAARMAAGQAQVDIPWQYAMQHADQVRQRRDLAHKLGMEEAGMITGDYYDYLGDRIATGNIDNQMMQQFLGEQPPAFG